MIEVIGPWQNQTREELIKRHPDLYVDDGLHIAWIGHDPDPNRKGWTVWWDGDTVVEINTPAAIGGPKSEERLREWEYIRKIVNQSF